MQLSLRNSLLVVAVMTLLSSQGDAAPKSHIKERGHATMTAPLTATASAPVGATGLATIEISKPKFIDAQSAELTLTTTGLAPGSYSVDATLQDLSTAHLADLVVDPAVPGDDGGITPVVVSVPVEVDALKISNVTISDAAAVVLLEGAATVTTDDWK